MVILIEVIENEHQHVFFIKVKKLQVWQSINWLGKRTKVKCCEFHAVAFISIFAIKNFKQNYDRFFLMSMNAHVLYPSLLKLIYGFCLLVFKLKINEMWL